MIKDFQEPGGEVTFYKDFGDEHLDFPRPKRVYAKVDSFEQGAEGALDGSALFFDAIDADFFDESKLNRGDIGPETFDEQVSILELRGRIAMDLVPGGKLNEERFEWFEFDFEGQGVALLQYLNLFGPGVERGAGYYPCALATTEHLDDVLSLDDFEDAEEDDIKRAIDVSGDDGAAVFDVGQGNCNAVVNSDGQPLLYYDFGGGVMGNVSTYPSGLDYLCFSKDPAIVLSHWDWDHWSTALRVRSHWNKALLGAGYAKSLAVTWIVPRQARALGAVHRGFLAKLANVLVWPAGLASLSMFNITVHKCNGPASNRNHSGLAMTYTPPWSHGDGILFTGDCDYRYLPIACLSTAGYDAVIVPHHGGPLSPSTTLPVPAISAPYTRLCYSYGVGNTFSHPNSRTDSSHVTAGWSPGMKLETSKRASMTNSNSAGHIWLMPSAMPGGTSHCGLGSCDTGYTQS